MSGKTSLCDYLFQYFPFNKPGSSSTLYHMICIILFCLQSRSVCINTANCWNNGVKRLNNSDNLWVSLQHRYCNSGNTLCIRRFCVRSTWACRCTCFSRKFSCLLPDISCSRSPEDLCTLHRSCGKADRLCCWFRKSLKRTDISFLLTRAPGS